MTMKISTLEKPQGNNWHSAKRYHVDFYNAKFPFCGGYLVYVVVGRKCVRVTQGDLVSPDKKIRTNLTRFKMSVNDWQQLKKEIPHANL